jgi:hypothetical protein
LHAKIVAEDNATRKLRMARIDDIVLLDHPADPSRPRSINCYQITEHSADGAPFKLDPSRLVYGLRWLHNATPPDFELVLMQQDAELWERWLSAASLMLLAELRRRAPHAIDWTAMRNVVSVLDAFEAARGSGNRAAALTAARWRVACCPHGSVRAGGEQPVPAVPCSVVESAGRRASAMYKICSFSQLAAVEQQQVVVATFIPLDFEVSTVKWIFEIWDRLYERSGSVWHVVVPVKYPPPQRELKPEDFDYNLAKELRNSMGVSKKKLRASSSTIS